MTKKKLGNIFYEGYHHAGADNELYYRLKKKNLVEYCPEAKITHHHYCTQTRGTEASPMDEFYARIEKHKDEDRKLLYKRQKELNFGPKVAVFCTTYNEAERIEEFVRENLKYVDEIYISDNNSTDKTREIAERAGANVRNSHIYHTPEHFLEADAKRQAEAFALEGDCGWLLYLDADEILEERAEDLLPELINCERYDSYGVRIPTFWLGRTHFRVDGDFKKFYLEKPYPTKLWRRGCGISMAAGKGGHSYPVYKGMRGRMGSLHPNFHNSELQIKHYAFDTKEIALRKYNTYNKHYTKGRYEHLHPDFKGVTLKKWNPKK